MAKIIIKDAQDARFVAEFFGMPNIPTENTRGAFPIDRLGKWLAQYDHELDRTGYRPSNEVPRADKTYRVRTMVKANGKGKGRTETLIPAYTEITLSEVRKLTGTEEGKRGRPGRLAIIEAVIAREGWKPIDPRPDAFEIR